VCACSFVCVCLCVCASERLLKCRLSELDPFPQAVYFEGAPFSNHYWQEPASAVYCLHDASPTQSTGCLAKPRCGSTRLRAESLPVVCVCVCVSVCVCLCVCVSVCVCVCEYVGD